MGKLDKPEQRYSLHRNWLVFFKHVQVIKDEEEHSFQIKGDKRAMNGDK